MPEFGLIGVDWEERVNFDRMRRERLQKAKKALENSDLNALFVFRLEDVRYITGFRSHLGPVATLGIGVVILAKGADPVLCTTDWAHARERMPWMKPENIMERPNIRWAGGIQKWGEEMKAKFGKVLEGKIGVDLATGVMMEWLPKIFPKAQFVDGKMVLAQAQMTKTKDEMECQKIASMITEAGFQALLENLKPGIRECELLAIAWQKFTELGSEWSQCANIVCSGPYTAPYRRFTSDRIIREGDLVIVDIGGCFNGYWGDFTRTFICGNRKPPKEQIDIYQEDYNTLFNACAEAVVGKTNGDIGRHLNDPVENPHSNGLSSGHGAGVGPWEPPWLSRALTPDAIIPLQPGMLFSIEPYAGVPGIGGVRLENQLFVTDGKKPEIFTTMPFEERLLRDIHPLDKTTGKTK